MRVAEAAVIAAIISAGAVRRAEAQQNAPAIADSASVLFTYDEQRASDATRAALVRLIIGASPAESWVETSVLGEESKDSTINRVYHYYRRDQKTGGGYPLTTEALIAAIDSANPGPASWTWQGRSIRVPPVPARGHERYGYAPTIRTFDTKSQQYGQFSALKLNVQGMRVFGGARGIANVSARVTPIRNASVTAIAIAIPSGFLKQARAILNSLPASELDAHVPGGVLHLDLFPNDAEAECADPALWKQTSPYRALVQGRIRALTAAERTALAGRAARSPLTIVDYDVANTGHGSKVRRVVSTTLRQFALDSILDPLVQTIDLDPVANREALKQILGDYESFLRQTNRTTSHSASDFLYARAWLDSSKSYEFAQTHEQVLIAALWKALVRGRGIANLSFGVENPALYLTPPGFGENPNTFGVLAAGNAQAPLGLRTSIQNTASTHPRLVNVTYGTEMGLVSGAFSDPPNGTTVSIVAPGCASYGSHVAPSDVGSSFASPFVATAAWVSSLLDGLSELRERLTIAVAPFPGPTATVNGDGVFDPWLFVAWPALRAHVIRADGTIGRLTGMQLNGVIAGDEDPQAFTIASRPVATTPRGLLVYADRTGVQGWLRRSAAPGSSAVRGSLSQVTGQLIVDGEVIRVATPGDLQKAVRAIWY